MKFREAVREAIAQAMERDPHVFVIGVGIVDPRAVWGTLVGIRDKFGPERFVEGPLSENALTGLCVGAATMGLRPLLVHHRIDFTLLSLDQLVNHAAKWRAMFGHQQTVPMVVRAVVGRGWGNGPQHTQSHHALFAHVPGLKVVVPATPEDAKGLLIGALEDDEPVIYIEHRWLHEDEGPVPAEYYTVPLGRAAVVRPGRDLTVAAVGPMVPEALRAAQALETAGISVEVIDVRTLRPLDSQTILGSVARTGRLVVADADWGPCGVAGEIVARAAEEIFDLLRARPVRVTWPDTAVPSSQELEARFYPGAREIQEAAAAVCESAHPPGAVTSAVKPFEGPF